MTTFYDPQFIREWRYVLCTRMGVPLQAISRVSLNKTHLRRRNRPAAVAGTVISDDPIIRTTWEHGTGADHLPFLDEGNRSLKAWRLEETGWVIRFAGLVWTVEDNADLVSVPRTAFTAFDPLQMLWKRSVLGPAGEDDIDVSFDPDTPGTEILKQLIERTHTYDGPTGLSIGAITDSVPISVTEDSPFTQGTKIGDAMVDLLSTGTFDIRVTPVDRHDGILGELTMAPAMGEERLGAVFAFGMSPHTISRWGRMGDVDELVNKLDSYGGPRPERGVDWPIRETRTSSGSQALYGVHRRVDPRPDLVSQPLVAKLADEQIASFANPRKMVSFGPHPFRSPVVISDYDIHDTVRVLASNTVREPEDGMQRVEELTIEISDHGYETVGEVVASP